MWFFKQFIEFYWLLRLFGFYGARSAARAWTFVLSAFFLFFFTFLFFVIYMTNYYQPPHEGYNYSKPPTQAQLKAADDQIRRNYDNNRKIVCHDMPDMCHLFKPYPY